jgi:putative ATP-dependent endonuclease of OLD family
MIRIDRIKIKNFRSIKSATLIFDDYSILVGKNNCGKSNIIQAINRAFDFTYIEKEDVFTSISEPFDLRKKVIIDLKIVPIDNSGNILKKFDDEWTFAFGNSITIDPTTDDEYFAFRTEYSYDNDKEYFTCKKVEITNWVEDGNSSTGKSISRITLECIENILINAQRDLSIDINDKKSFWSRTTANISIPDNIRSSIEKQLVQLNSKIIKGSDILKLMKKTLKSTTADKVSTVEISPITKDIETIYKGMNIYYSDSDVQSVPIDSLGLGVRSWGVFSSIKAYILSRADKKGNQNKAYHPLTLIEEPEAHVHPQAQRQLFSDINDIIGQKVITTHSPYILSQVSLKKINYVRKNGPGTEIFPLIVNDLSEDDIHKIKRVVMNTRGEIIYANAVILAEGETEEQSLTVFLREYFKKEPFELGINIVGVGGGNYLPFIRLLEKIGIKWYIFSDGEQQPVDGLKACIKKLYSLPSSPDLNNYPNIFVLENGDCLETYFLRENYKNEIKKALDIVENQTNY